MVSNVYRVPSIDRMAEHGSEAGRFVKDRSFGATAKRRRESAVLDQPSGSEKLACMRSTAGCGRLEELAELHRPTKAGITVSESSGAAMEETTKSRISVRKRADEIKPFRCKNLIAVIENPTDIGNIGTVIRNANALGVEKVYVVDPRRSLPEDWQDLRNARSISKTSVSAVKWTFVKRFDSTEDCFDHLEKKGFRSIVTSPHVKGKTSIFLHEGDYTAQTKLAVWFGSEAVGISDLAVARSEMCVSVPMFGMIESLNLGTSSGIVLYEVAKQRREYQSRYRLRDGRGARAIPLPTVIAPKA